jgi:hypothetical protein
MAAKNSQWEGIHSDELTGWALELLADELTGWALELLADAVKEGGPGESASSF